MALFRPIRRMLSPREAERVRCSESTPPDTPVSATSGGRPSVGDMDSVVVDNAIYSEPAPLSDHPVHRVSSGDGLPFPPPRPHSGPQTNSEEKEAYYQAPVDTLGRGSALEHPRSFSTRVNEKERERKMMDMHERTLNQIQGGGHPVQMVTGGGLGHRRTRSGGHLIDNEEYSTPWDVQGEQKRRSTHHNTSGNPPKPSRNKRPIPATPSDGSDNIIPLSPTPILSGHERSQSASPVPPRSPLQPTAGGDAEYDDPWDVRNRNISHVIPGRHSVHDRRSPPSGGGGGGGGGEHRPRQSVGSRSERSHLEEVRPSRSGSERTPRGPDIPDQFRHRTITDIHSHNPRSSSMGTPISHPIQRRPLPEEPGLVLGGGGGGVGVGGGSGVGVGVSGGGGGGGSIVSSGASSAPSSVANSARMEPSALFDCNLALEEQSWYHGAITRADAEAILANKPDFSFLVRNSESCRTDYSLSIRDRSSGFIHLRIVYERSGYVLGQFSSHFQTVPECIFFYTQQRLNIRGTDHKKLRYPVPRDHYKP